MSLVTDIQTIVNTLYPDATFRVMSDFHANAESTKLGFNEFPLISLDNMFKKRVQINPNANLSKRTPLKMWFLTKSITKQNVYLTDLELEALYISMELHADRVFNNIYQLDSIRINQNEISEYETERKSKVFAPVLSGVLATANWKENNIVSWCKVPPT